MLVVEPPLVVLGARGVEDPLAEALAHAAEVVAERLAIALAGERRQQMRLPADEAVPDVEDLLDLVLHHLVRQAQVLRRLRLRTGRSPSSARSPPASPATCDRRCRAVYPGMSGPRWPPGLCEAERPAPITPDNTQAAIRCQKALFGKVVTRWFTTTVRPDATRERGARGHDPRGGDGREHRRLEVAVAPARPVRRRTRRAERIAARLPESFVESDDERPRKTLASASCSHRVRRQAAARGGVRPDSVRPALRACPSTRCASCRRTSTTAASRTSADRLAVEQLERSASVRPSARGFDHL